MAPRKGTPSPPARKIAAKPASERRVAREATPISSSSSNNTSRLLREAAWSQMFGRVESKNPFAR